MRQRIVAIFGGKTNEKLVPVSEDTDLIKINGFVGKPEFAKKSRGEQFFFVNDRYIKSPYLHHAIMSAFEGLLKEGNQPSYFLYLQVPPHTIDINIHPTKTEIKFDDEHSLYAILRSSVKHSLGQFNVAPILDFERDSNLDTPYQYKDKTADFPTIQVDSGFNPFAAEKPSKSLASFGSYKKDTPQGNWESLYVGLKQDSDEIASFSFESTEVTGSLFESEAIEATAHATLSNSQKIHCEYHQVRNVSNGSRTSAPKGLIRTIFNQYYHTKSGEPAIVVSLGVVFFGRRNASIARHAAHFRKYRFCF